MKMKLLTILCIITLMIQLQKLTTYGQSQYNTKTYKSLKGHVRRQNILRAVRVASVTQCAVQCTDDSLCKFFNVENKSPTGQRICDLVGGSNNVAPDVDVHYTLYYRECPVDWFHQQIFLGSCYAFLESDMTWEQANFYCQTLGDGVHLVQIESQEEYDALNTWILANAGKFNPYTEGWLGAKRLADDRAIEWVSNREPIGYNRFAGTSHMTAIGELSCVKMMLDTSAYPNVAFKWYTTDCNRIFHWAFCEA